MNFMSEDDQTSGLLGFLHRELGCRVGFEAGVGDRSPAPDRQPKGPVVEPPVGSVKRRQTLPKLDAHRIIALFGGQALRGVGEVARLVGLITVFPAGGQRVI